MAFPVRCGRPRLACTEPGPQPHPAPLRWTGMPAASHALPPNVSARPKKNALVTHFEPNVGYRPCVIWTSTYCDNFQFSFVHVPANSSHCESFTLSSLRRGKSRKGVFLHPNCLKMHLSISCYIWSKCSPGSPWRGNDPDPWPQCPTATENPQQLLASFVRPKPGQAHWLII